MQTASGKAAYLWNLASDLHLWSVCLRTVVLICLWLDGLTSDLPMSSFAQLWRESTTSSGMCGCKQGVPCVICLSWIKDNWALCAKRLDFGMEKFDVNRGEVGHSQQPL